MHAIKLKTITHTIAEVRKQPPFHLYHSREYLESIILNFDKKDFYGMVDLYLSQKFEI